MPFWGFKRKTELSEIRNIDDVRSGDGGRDRGPNLDGLRAVEYRCAPSKKTPVLARQEDES